MSKWIELNSLRHQVAIAGQVSDKETGQTIGNALVEITAMPDAFKTKRSLQALQYGSQWETLAKRCDRTTSAIDGFFYFIDLPPGEYTLTASLPSAAARYKIAETTVTLPPSNNNSNQPKFAVANLALSPSGIRGKVTDLQGVAIARVKVKILGSGETTVTDGEGNYQLIGLEAPKQESVKRTVKVIVTTKGDRETTETLQFSLGEVIEHNFKLVKQNGTAVKTNNTS
ncbi:MAG: carboxypeptidase-like regulatory domain-containing protein [Oscillatoriaceae cyanobacterium Prado104]|nr:carboxypeptidase-like regulatory domain-containing protein [Oscillatoriaceae cyanobacterium Prado104]